MLDQHEDSQRSTYTALRRPTNGIALAGFVFGCLAVAICFMPLVGVPAIIFGVLAAGFGGIGRSHGDKLFGTAAIILGVFGLIVSLTITSIMLNNLNDMSKRFNELTNIPGLTAPISPNSGSTVQPGPVETGGVFEYYTEGGSEGDYDIVFGGDSKMEATSSEFGSQVFTEALGRSSEVSIILSSSAGTQTLSCEIAVDGAIVDSQTGDGFVECHASLPA